MIDIHSHILYGLDDGAQTLEDTLNMARQANDDGISVIVCTPHHKDGTYMNPPAKIRERCEEVQGLLDQQGIPLRILPGMEIHVDGGIREELLENKLLTYNDKNRHILLELPHDHVPRYLDKLIFNLQVIGYVPIIPHPERNKEIQGNLNLLYRMVKQGAMAQLTAASVAGKFGKKIQKSCFDMIQHQMIHFIATDAHNTSNRGFVLSEAYQVVENKFGMDYVEMYQEFARNISEGKDCLVMPVEKIKIKKFFGLF